MNEGRTTILRRIASTGTILLMMACLAVWPAIAAECNPLVANVRDVGFSVVWGAPAATTGYVMFGTNSGNLAQQACDVRDDSVDCSGTFDTHFVQITGLNPSTQYYVQRFEDGLATGPEFAVSTGPPLAPGVPDTAFGVLRRTDGVTHAIGAYVCVTIRGGGGTGHISTPECDLVELPSDLGFWAVSLGNARSLDLSSRFSYSSGGDVLTLRACGGPEGEAFGSVDTADDSPAADLQLAPPAPVPASNTQLLILMALLLAPPIIYRRVAAGSGSPGNAVTQRRDGGSAASHRGVAE